MHFRGFIILIAWYRITCPHKVKLHCKSVMWCDGRGLSHDDSAPTLKEQWLTEWFDENLMQIMCYGLHSHQISTQLIIICRRLWTSVLYNALHHQNQSANWGNIFWRDGFHSSNTAPEACTVQSMPMGIESVLATCSVHHLTNTSLTYFSPFIL